MTTTLWHTTQISSRSGPHTSFRDSRTSAHAGITTRCVRTQADNSYSDGTHRRVRRFTSDTTTILITTALIHIQDSSSRVLNETAARFLSVHRTCSERVFKFLPPLV